MSWMSVVKWSHPKLTVGAQMPGELLRRNELGWQDILRCVANIEMDVRRLHASKLYDRGMQVDGKITVVFRIEPTDEVFLEHVTSDPALDTIKDEVAHMVVNAGYPRSGRRMTVEIDCSFQSATSTGWGGDDFGTPSRGRGGGFGDPF
mgnify:CR=1 FL=1